jgi:hypothetical protein
MISYNKITELKILVNLYTKKMQVRKRSEKTVQSLKEVREKEL